MDLGGVDGAGLAARRPLAAALSTAAAEYAAAPYRELRAASASQKAAWAARDESLHAEMRARVPAALEHNGEEAFDAHLVGVQSVLRAWDAPEHVCDAALFHSIYGTEGFQGYSLPLSERKGIVDLVGERAERIAWIFCMVDRFAPREPSSRVAAAAAAATRIVRGSRRRRGRDADHVRGRNLGAALVAAPSETRIPKMVHFRSGGASTRRF